MLARLALTGALATWCYEACAILRGSWPTITSLVRRHRRSSPVRVAVVAGLAVLGRHLLGGER